MNPDVKDVELLSDGITHEEETEKVELTEEEKREQFIEAVKESHLRYNTKKDFGDKYKAKKKKKLKMTKKSRKNNRKKKK